MKTPKRKTPYSVFTPRYYNWEGPNDDAVLAQRWKRKNRIAQLKRTIARLTLKLRREREYRRLLLAEYSRVAQIARNAKQNTSICTDAEQLTERKEQA